jgi:hypothetical protein
MSGYENFRDLIDGDQRDLTQAQKRILKLKKYFVYILNFLAPNKGLVDFEGALQFFQLTPIPPQFLKDNFNSFREVISILEELERAGEDVYFKRQSVTPKKALCN